jgi:hypothetical protein
MHKYSSVGSDCISTGRFASAREHGPQRGPLVLIFQSSMQNVFLDIRVCTNAPLRATRPRHASRCQVRVKVLPDDMYVKFTQIFQLSLNICNYYFINSYTQLRYLRAGCFCVSSPRYRVELTVVFRCRLPFVMRLTLGRSGTSWILTAGQDAVRDNSAVV